MNRSKPFGRLLRRAAVAFLLVVAPGSAAEAQAPPLTPGQAAIARRLDRMLIAPCCFANTLAKHHSPVADQLRQELRTLRQLLL